MLVTNYCINQTKWLNHCSVCAGAYVLCVSVCIKVNNEGVRRGKKRKAISGRGKEQEERREDKQNNRD